jgi:hypothetical protein
MIRTIRKKSSGKRAFSMFWIKSRLENQGWCVMGPCTFLEGAELAGWFHLLPQRGLEDVSGRL